MKKAGLEVVEHDRVVAVKLLGRLRETVAQLDLVAGSQADQDRLVVPLGRFGVGVIEPVEQRRWPAGSWLWKSNFGCRLAIRTRPTSWI